MIRLINLRIVVSKDFSCKFFFYPPSTSPFLPHPHCPSFPSPIQLTPHHRHIHQNLPLVANRAHDRHHLRLPHHLPPPLHLRHETRPLEIPQLDQQHFSLNHQTKRVLQPHGTPPPRQRQPSLARWRTTGRRDPVQRLRGCRR